MQIPRTLALVLLLLLSGCRSSPRDGDREGPPPLETAEMGSMESVSVSGWLWLGSEPSPEDLDLAARRGIERIVALGDAREPSYDLQEACRAAGLRCFDLRTKPNGVAPVPDGAVDPVVAMLGEAEPRATLLFADDAAWSAALFAIHRAVNAGLALEQAVREARRAGLRGGAPEEFVRRHVQRLVGEREPAGGQEPR